MAGSPQFPKVRGPDGLVSRTQDNVAGQLGPVAKAVAATPLMGAAPPAWIRITYAQDFTDAAGAGAGATFSPPQSAYHRDALGYVWVKLATLTAAGSAALSTMAVLPLGYRPRDFNIFPVLNAATGAIVPLGVTPTGLLTPVAILGAGAGIKGYFSFLADG